MSGPHVGLVLVSHSEKLAEGVAELAAQLGGDEVPIKAAGGTDDGGLGTSIEKVERAIREADRGAGVLLLADLGSAVLTIKALLDDDAPASRVQLADAPLVEGAIAAVVTASAGADLATVLASAEEARSYRKL
ncbi:MAG TPA: dihydroxyacetone kinase phosphoryl donor subunit DhaM [Actinocrinis sp.]|nr:dihydroxyacetone kinase phosphoryl donor subunit DhaM [Actinocrinis sp.]